MSDVLRDIEQSYEAKYKLDEELHFKVTSRCNKMFGLWAADHLGLDGQQAEEYARRLVRHNLDQPHGASVVDAVLGEFKDSGVRLTEADVHAAFNRFHALACEQVGTDYPTPLGTDHIQVGG